MHPSAMARSLLEAAGGGGGAAAVANSTGPALMDITLGGVLETSLTDLWLLFCGYLVFFQQCGFALLEAGSVRQKNVRNILLKNVIDACVAVLMWWAVGAALEGVTECGGSAFVGKTGFFLSGDTAATPGYMSRWFFGWAFSATASTLVSGAVAERLRFRSYLCYTFLITGLVYPVAAHWVWSPDGWLSPTRRDCATGQPLTTFPGSVGLIDFSGSGVVHLLGGTAALVGAAVLGPRLGRYTSAGHLVDLPGCNPAQVALGTFILWLGWYGFNPGSTGCFYGCMPLAAKIAVNTTLGAGAGGLTTLALTVVLGAPGDVGPLLNGIIAGLVSITGSCAVVAPWAAVVIGGLGGCFYTCSSWLLRKARIDDPLDVSAVHGCCGAWGLIAGGLFATQAGVQEAYGRPPEGWGLFFGGGGTQLGVQLLGLVSIFAWSAALNACLFLTLRAIGWLRVPKEEEIQGLDYTQSIGGGAAFWFLRGVKAQPSDDQNLSHTSSGL